MLDPSRQSYLQDARRACDELSRVGQIAQNGVDTEERIEAIVAALRQAYTAIDAILSALEQPS